MTKASPRPWRTSSSRRTEKVKILNDVYNEIGYFKTYDDGHKAVEAVNSHDRLVAENERLRKSLQFMVDAAETEPGMNIYSAHIEQAKQALTESGELS